MSSISFVVGSGDDLDAEIVRLVEATQLSSTSKGSDIPEDFNPKPSVSLVDEPTEPLDIFKSINIPGAFNPNSPVSLVDETDPSCCEQVNFFLKSFFACLNFEKYFQKKNA